MRSCPSCTGTVHIPNRGFGNFPASFLPATGVQPTQFDAEGVAQPDRSATAAQAHDLAQTAAYSVVGALALYWMGVSPRVLAFGFLGAFVLKTAQAAFAKEG
jgi:hypothetical protein